MKGMQVYDLVFMGGGFENELHLKNTYLERADLLIKDVKDFSKKFIKLARNVYINNDKRAKIKSEINKLLGSNIKEVKKYANY